MREIHSMDDIPSIKLLLTLRKTAYALTTREKTLKTIASTYDVDLRDQASRHLLSLINQGISEEDLLKEVDKIKARFSL